VHDDTFASRCRLALIMKRAGKKDRPAMAFDSFRDLLFKFPIFVLNAPKKIPYSGKV